MQEVISNQKLIRCSNCLIRGITQTLGAVLPNSTVLVQRTWNNGAYRDYTIITGDNFTITCGKCGKANYAVQEGREYELSFIGSVGLLWQTINGTLGSIGTQSGTN